MAAFDQMRNSAIWSNDPQNPTLEPNMKSIGWPVVEILHLKFEIFQMRGRLVISCCVRNIVREIVEMLTLTVLSLQSLGCTLYALCFYESPFDAVYQRGDSVALAVISGSVNIPNSSESVPYISVAF